MRQIRHQNVIVLPGCYNVLVSWPGYGTPQQDSAKSRPFHFSTPSGVVVNICQPANLFVYCRVIHIIHKSIFISYSCGSIIIHCPGEGDLKQLGMEIQEVIRSWMLFCCICGVLIQQAQRSMVIWIKRC